MGIFQSVKIIPWVLANALYLHGCHILFIHLIPHLFHSEKKLLKQPSNTPFSLLWLSLLNVKILSHLGYANRNGQMNINLNYTNYEVEGDTYILKMRGCDPSSIQVLRIIPNTVWYPKLRTNMLRYSNIFSV